MGSLPVEVNQITAGIHLANNHEGSAEEDGSSTLPSKERSVFVGGSWLRRPGGFASLGMP